MIVRILTSVVLLCVSTPAFAETIRVRSGEHETFTRFVFYVPTGIEADVRPVARGIEVHSNAPDTRFETEGIFRRIPRTRVAEIASPANGVLRLSLVCNCRHSVTRDGRGLLIIDIGGSRRDNPIRRLTFGQLEKGKEAFGLRSPVTRLVYSTAPEPSVQTQTRDNGSGADGQPLMPVHLPDLTTESGHARTTRVQKAEEVIARQIARATTQGLLEPSPGQSSVKHLAPEISGTGPAMLADPKRSSGQVAAKSALDDAFSSPREGRPVPSGKVPCLRPELLEVSDWGGTEDFSSELGARRAALYGERDRGDRKAMLSLTRFYLHYGFGVEAAGVLNQSPDESEEWQILMAMAVLLQDGRRQMPTHFEGQIECSGPAALWSALGAYDLSHGPPPNVPEILLAFNSLPSPLRDVLGPGLARKLTDFGRPDDAAAVLAIMSRVTGPDNPAQDMLRARLAVARGDADKAIPLLGQLVETNTEESPEALIDLLELQRETGMHPTPAQRSLADAYAVELRGQALHGDMERAAILAAAELGDFHSAIERLERSDADEVKKDAIRSRIVHLVVRDADDLTFVGLATQLTDARPEHLSPEAGNALAARLADIGFAEPAHTFLSGPAEGDAARQRRMIRARLSLSQGNPRRALAALLGLEGLEAESLRAEALSQSGDNARAAALFQRIGDTERAERESRLAGNWSAAALSTITPAQSVNSPDAPIPSSSTQGPQERESIIDRNRSFLRELDASRKAIDELLSETLDPAES